MKLEYTIYEDRINPKGWVCMTTTQNVSFIIIITFCFCLDLQFYKIYLKLYSVNQAMTQTNESILNLNFISLS